MVRYQINHQRYSVVRLLHQKFMILCRPKNLIKICQRSLKPSFWCALFFALLTAFWIFFYQPKDYVQGTSSYILFVHVPLSWGALLIYMFMGGFSAYGLITRMPQAFLFAKALAPIGLTYCFLSLVTGSLWGKPTWGAFWVWDARLTSMLILFYFYGIYLFLSQRLEYRRLMMASFFATIGLINIPIIKGSVNWWFTLHQGPSLNILKRTSHMDFKILIPLLLATGVFFFITVHLMCLRIPVLLHANWRFKNQKSHQESEQL